MKALEDKILAEGKVFPGGILKVDGFLNHNIDSAFLKEIGKEIARLYKGCGVTKVLTIEASGIAIAVAAGMEMGVPVLFAKKTKTLNIASTVYSTKVHSFTHQTDYDVIVSREYLSSDDTVLIVDDFLAAGNALSGLVDLVEQAGAALAGAAIAIEKAFQKGGDRLRASGVRVESLARIEKMTDTAIVFCK